MQKTELRLCQIKGPKTTGEPKSISHNVAAHERACTRRAAARTPLPSPIHRDYGILIGHSVGALRNSRLAIMQLTRLGITSRTSTFTINSRTSLAVSCYMLK